MRLKKENKKVLLHLYWIIQGISYVFGIKGIGELSLIGGSFLIAITILKICVNNKFLNILFIIMYLIYSCLFLLTWMYITKMIGFNIILFIFLIIGVFNFVCIYFMKDIEP